MASQQFLEGWHARVIAACRMDHRHAVFFAHLVHVDLGLVKQESRDVIATMRGAGVGQRREAFQLGPEA